MSTAAAKLSTIASLVDSISYQSKLHTASAAEVWVGRVSLGGVSTAALLYRARDVGQAARDRLTMSSAVFKAIQHTSVPRVVGFTSDHQESVLALELIDGRSLRTLLASARAKGITLAPHEAAHLAREILSGVRQVHLSQRQLGDAVGHGSLDLTHVWVSRSGEVKVLPPAADPQVAPTAGGDAAAWGRLVHELLTSHWYDDPSHPAAPTALRDDLSSVLTALPTLATDDYAKALDECEKVLSQQGDGAAAAADIAWFFSSVLPDYQPIDVEEKRAEAAPAPVASTPLGRLAPPKSDQVPPPSAPAMTAPLQHSLDSVPALSPEAAGHTILLATTESKDIPGLAAALSHTPFRVDSVHSADKLRTRLNTPLAALVLDVAYPRVDIPMLVRRMRNASATAGVPILLIARQDEAAVVTAALQAGADDVIASPTDATTVATTLLRFLKSTWAGPSSDGLVAHA